MRDRLTRQRYGVTGLLITLFALTYLDRVCISVAGPRMQHDLHISPIGWGWVTGIFTLAYALFEIPSGALSDHIGPRKVLTRIVLWWSAFTALTGAVSGFAPLLVTRFLFGMGEAGAFPSASVVIARWFPGTRRASMCGVILMASQIGGIIAPLLVIPIQMRFGWRASFYVFGVLGLIWVAAWFWRFRDSPAEKLAAGNGVRGEIAILPRTGHRLRWSIALRSPSIQAIVAAAFCCIYVYNFFQTWFHTFLVKGRGLSEAGLLLSAMPFALAACANLAGGLISDALVRWLGLKNGRRLLGTLSLTAASVFTLAAMVTRRPVLTVVYLTLVYAFIALQQSACFGSCMDIAEHSAGAIIGLMNTGSQVGGLVGAVVYGYLVERFGYNAPFLPMAVLLLVGALLWLRIDASQPLPAECYLGVAAAGA